MKKKISRTQQLIGIVSSRYFFAGIVVLLVLQALWIALSGRYPMAFDEDFHLGIIRLYADHLSPFWAAHPAGADSFGAITRDPSYLFHYLMSFPYKLIAVFTDNQATQVLILRLTNISFFAAGLVLWRKALLKTGASKAIVHTSLLLLVLIPVVPLLAAQLNYDNLLMPVMAVVLLLAVKVNQDLAKYKRVDTESLLLLIIACMAASLIKYAFLPIVLAVVGYLIWRLWHTHEGAKKLALSVGFGWTTISRSMQWLLIILLLVTGVLFAERYGVNMARYHNPVPDCAQVISVDRCKQYGPWARNYRIMNDPTINNSSVASYAADWFHGMWLRSFFAVDGPGTNFEAKAPLLLPGMSVIVLAVISLIALLIKGKVVWRRYDSTVLWLFSLVVISYIGVLWLNGLQTFMELGQSVAINGRYLVLVAPILFLISALAVNELLGQQRRLTISFAALAIFCFAWGGGAATYVLRANNAWYWPNSTVQSVNGTLRDTFGPITPGYYSPTKFLWRN